MSSWGRSVDSIALLCAVVLPLVWLLRVAAREAKVPFLCRRPHRFLLVRPGRWGWWMRRRWYPRVALTGDATLDSEWSVESRDRELMDAMVRRPDVRAALRSLGGVGCRVVAQQPKRLLATLRFPKETRVTEAAHIEPARQALRALDLAARDVCRTFECPHRPPSWRLVSLVALEILGFLGVFATLARWIGTASVFPDLLGLFALLGLPLGLLAAPLILRFLRGHVGPFMDLVGPCILMTMLLGFAAMVAARELNERLDRGPVRVLVSPVVAVHESPGRRDSVRGDEVVLETPGTGATQSLYLPRSIASGLRPHESRLIVTTSPGWLGIEWQVRVQVESRPATK